MASQGGGFGGTNAGVIGGLLMMVIAVVWFGVGYMYLDRIFFYPPVLLILGLVATVKGAFGGGNG